MIYGIGKRFVNLTSYRCLAAAIDAAERQLSPNSRMMSELVSKNDWKYGAGTGEEVSRQLLKCQKIVGIYTYRPWWPWSKACAYFDGRAIHLNRYKFKKLTFEQVVGILCHEYAHAAGFTHGNNYKTAEKCLYSVPYYVSENIGRWL